VSCSASLPHEEGRCPPSTARAPQQCEAVLRAAAAVDPNGGSPSPAGSSEGARCNVLLMCRFWTSVFPVPRMHRKATREGRLAHPQAGSLCSIQLRHGVRMGGADPGSQSCARGGVWQTWRDYHHLEELSSSFPPCLVCRKPPSTGSPAPAPATGNSPLLCLFLPPNRSTARVNPLD
jgi:hypothetical protein